MKYNCSLCGLVLVPAEIQENVWYCENCTVYYKVNYGKLSIPFAKPPWEVETPTQDFVPKTPSVNEPRILSKEEERVLQICQQWGLVEEEMPRLKRFMALKGGADLIAFLQAERSVQKLLIAEFKKWEKGERVFLMK